MKILFSVFCLVLCNCGYDGPCALDTFTNITDHEFDFNYRTPELNTPVDLKNNGREVLPLIDKAVNEVMECNILPLTSEEIIAGDCSTEGKYLYTPEKCKNCLRVEIAKWTWNHDNTEQLLYDKAPITSCLAKGLKPTEKNPCRYRAGIQQGDGYFVVIATPNLKLFKDPLVRAMTGCYYPWSVSRLAECMKPVVSEE